MKLENWGQRAGNFKGEQKREESVKGRETRKKIT